MNLVDLPDLNVHLQSLFVQCSLVQITSVMRRFPNLRSVKLMLSGTYQYGFDFLKFCPHLETFRLEYLKGSVIGVKECRAFSHVGNLTNLYLNNVDPSAVVVLLNALPPTMRSLCFRPDCTIHLDLIQRRFPKLEALGIGIYYSDEVCLL